MFFYVHLFMLGGLLIILWRMVLFFRVPIIPAYLNLILVGCFRLAQFFSAGRLQLEQFFLEGGFLCLLDWKANKTRGVSATVAVVLRVRHSLLYPAHAYAGGLLHDYLGGEKV